MMQELAQHWGTEYDRGKCEAKLNGLPNFITEIDGLDIHFIHVRSQHEDALPVIVTHGWPGSIIEQLKIIEPLTNPTAHGAGASDAFHLVIPSLPGHGFSAKPASTGVGSRPHRACLGDPDEAPRIHAICGAGRRLGRRGDADDGCPGGSGVARHPFEHARHGSSRSCQGVRARRPAASRSRRGGATRVRAAEQLLRQARRLLADHVHRPQTLYGLADSPIDLASFMLDHGDGTGQPGLVQQVLEGRLQSDLTRDDILDNITLYWLTNTGVSAARLYWENKADFFDAKNITIPFAISVFPDELYQAPRSWAERAYPNNLIHYNRLDRGGHFAACEQPQLLAGEMRASFRPLRSTKICTSTAQPRTQRCCGTDAEAPCASREAWDLHRHERAGRNRGSQQDPAATLRARPVDESPAASTNDRSRRASRHRRPDFRPDRQRNQQLRAQTRVGDFAEAKRYRPGHCWFARSDVLGR
jgi:pimeloyl-ACP methyl ester carboxylesterase